MARLKLLKGIGHNTVHSYLSLMNYRENGYVIEHLYNIAEEKNIDNIVINILEKSITPKVFEIPIIKESLDDLLKDFERLLKSGNIPLDNVFSATASIIFNIEDPYIGVSSAKLETYDCFVEIIDKNEKLHKITVKEWWR
ncbi:hypothetical protein CN957_13665 [Bacillus cereus]|nr:hypothetical protein ICG_02920 [Bacillus cereus BAG1X1-3]EOO76986.1 hypothetical protein IC7_01975 [Bacillus cereus BAG1O-1]PEX40478.1 hypothetical protein CN464_30760 [Bacillus cereus]PFJ83842.1 hypothetical protein COI97_29735 [Bacillus cereus]PFM27233.1 hypothetical protein COJ42_26550 [Bacillus cereus]